MEESLDQSILLIWSINLDVSENIVRQNLQFLFQKRRVFKHAHLISRGENVACEFLINFKIWVVSESHRNLIFLAEAQPIGRCWCHLNFAPGIKLNINRIYCHCVFRSGKTFKCFPSPPTRFVCFFFWLGMLALPFSFIQYGQFSNDLLWQYTARIDVLLM